MCGEGKLRHTQKMSNDTVKYLQRTAGVCLMLCLLPSGDVWHSDIGVYNTEREGGAEGEHLQRVQTVTCKYVTVDVILHSCMCAVRCVFTVRRH